MSCRKWVMKQIQRGIYSILCGPGNTIGKCLLNLQNADKKEWRSRRMSKASINTTHWHATKHVRWLAKSLHLAFFFYLFHGLYQIRRTIRICGWYGKWGLHRYIFKMGNKIPRVVVFGASRNATFALHMDMMRHVKIKGKVGAVKLV